MQASAADAPFCRTSMPSVVRDGSKIARCFVSSNAVGVKDLQSTIWHLQPGSRGREPKVGKRDQDFQLLRCTTALDVKDCLSTVISCNQRNVLGNALFWIFDWMRRKSGEAKVRSISLFMQ